MLASVIVNACRVTLIDAQAATWSDDELLGYLNEARRTVVLLKPDAYTVREYLALVAGTKQQLPAGGVAILDCGDNEATGRVATLVDRELLDHMNRFWPAATPESGVMHWCADPRDPRRFDVAPPNDGTGSLEVLYGMTPAAVALGEEIGLLDVYQYPLECFTLARAYAKNTKRQDLGKSGGYMQEFRQSLGLKSVAQVAVAPKVNQNVGM
jgi:hypothetical protein